MNLSDKEKRFLLDLARQSIKQWFDKQTIPVVSESQIPPPIKEKRASFVTLMLNNELRGCIGHIQAQQPLYKNVIENALAAAFCDPRFPLLTKEGLEKIKIKISVLSEPKNFEYRSAEELINFLEKEKPGVIIRKGKCQSTFLPEVWSQFEKPEEFLSHLCLKSGLDPEEWQKGDLEVKTYNTQSFSE